MIFPLFLFSSQKLISKSRIKELLYKVPSLEQNERDYLMSVFEKYLTDGYLSKTEFEKVVMDLRKNYYDVLDPHEIEQLIGVFEAEYLKY